LYPLIYSINNKKKIKTKKYLPQIIKIVKTKKDVEDIEKRLTKKLAEVDEAIKKDVFKPCPSQACYWCPFGDKGTSNCPHYLKYEQKVLN
jgi:hypothetical protein